MTIAQFCQRLELRQQAARTKVFAHTSLVVQGYHSGSFIVALLGIFKAVVGLLVRPLVGTLELLGKSAHGVGLLFLGREGISGTIQKRARAPGTLTDDSDEVCVDFMQVSHY